MSFGASDGFKTKKALIEAVKARGAENVTAFDTSMINNQGTVTVASLAGTTAVIVGPDVRSQRDWYANVKIMKSGEIRVV